MSTTIVLGSQWGDEGKGKLVDILARNSTLCCRAAGGNNAGHTIVADGKVFDFHILPSGLISEECMNLVGSGCVVHVPSFFKEMEALKEKGLKKVEERVLLSERAHICFDLHVTVDGLEELGRGGANSGGKAIGTTKKGIGPCYADKVARRGVPAWMLYTGEKDGAEGGVGEWERRLRELEKGYRRLFGDVALAAYDIEDEVRRFKGYRERLRPHIISPAPLLSHYSSPLPSNKNQILVEGCQALMLDIDSGTYPYVTSSNTGLGGVFTGLGGLNITSVKNIIGVVKAYTTRVGGGPFPTELLDEAGETLQTVGREFGVTTGRRRRCGWCDLVVVKYSAQVNCYTALNLTKLDILDGFKEIKVATAYVDADGNELETFPADLQRLEETLAEKQLKIKYDTLDGWLTSTTGCKRWEDLPAKAREYVKFIEDRVGVPVQYIGTGPHREHMIARWPTWCHS